MGIRSVFLFIVFFTVITSIAYARDYIPSVTVHQTSPSKITPSGTLSSIITKQDIATSGATSLAQLLELSSKVQLRNMSGNNNAASISMRGFGANASSNSLLLINGIPVTNPDMASPQLNLIPVDDIETVSIVAGSESVMYGDQAVGGIININTRHSPERSYTLACGTGSYNAHQCHVILNNQYRDLHYYLNANLENTNNYRLHNGYYQQSLSGQLDTHTEKSATVFGYQVQNQNIEFPGALTAAQVRQNRRQSTNQIDFFHDTNSFFHLTHKQSLNTDWVLKTDLARRQMNGHGVLFSPFTQGRQSYYIRPALIGHWQQLTIHTGTSLQSDDYHLNSVFGPNTNKQQKFDLYSLLTVPIYTNTSLSLGARGAGQTSRINSTTSSEYINRALATTIGITHSLSNTIHFYLRRAGSYRFPKADENASSNTGIIGLRTQRGYAYETGIEINRKKYFADVHVYQLNLRDEIAFDPTQTSQQPFGSNTNLAPTKRNGISLAGRYQPSEKLSFNSQWNFVNAIFQNGIYKNNRIPLVSEAIINAGINYHFTEAWRIYAEGIYTGNQYSANDNANIAGAVGGYTIYNTLIGYQRKNLSVSLRFNNMFNKVYYVYTVYQSGFGESFYPAPERNFMLSFNYLIT